MEEERVIGLGVLDEPMHCSEYILFVRLTHRILLVVRQENHVFSRVSKITIQVCRHILYIINAPSQLTPLTKVVDTDKQGFPSSCAVRVLEIVSLRGAGTEPLLALGRRWRSVMVPLVVGIRVD